MVSNLLEWVKLGINQRISNKVKRLYQLLLCFGETPKLIQEIKIDQFIQVAYFTDKKWSWLMPIRREICPIYGPKSNGQILITHIEKPLLAMRYIFLKIYNLIKLSLFISTKKCMIYYSRTINNGFYNVPHLIWNPQRIWSRYILGTYTLYIDCWS